MWIKEATIICNLLLTSVVCFQYLDRVFTLNICYISNVSIFTTVPNGDCSYYGNTSCLIALGTRVDCPRVGISPPVASPRRQFFHAPCTLTNRIRVSIVCRSLFDNILCIWYHIRSTSWSTVGRASLSGSTHFQYIAWVDSVKDGFSIQRCQLMRIHAVCSCNGIKWITILDNVRVRMNSLSPNCSQNSGRS